MAKKRNKKKSKYINKFIILIISLFLGIFFILWGKIHIFLATMIPHLHFCSYLACVIFSLIWFAFMGIAIYYLTKKRKRMGKIWYIPMGVILIVGIILMNLTYCDSDGMHFGFGAGYFAQSLIGSTMDDCKPGVDCPGDIVEVPIPPCIETDDGQDYITPGMILSGANLEDICLNTDILRERYCNSELTYTSEDVSCSDVFGLDWICEDRECILDTTPIITPPPADDNSENNPILCDDGLDNDGNGDIDCEDSNCLLYCEDCTHSLDFPDCNALCDTGSCEPMYTETGGWCTCLPDGETACRSSEQTMPIFCGGWCEDDMFCIHDETDCYCSDFPCRDTDGGYYPETPGDCIGDDVWFTDYCNFLGDYGIATLIEYTCSDQGCIENVINCSSLYGGAGYICLDSKFGSYCGEGAP